MGSRRTAVAALLVAVTACAVPAHAAPARACRAVTDPAGDATLTHHDSTGTTNTAALDVRSADMASGPRNVTAVVRVTRLGTALEAAPRLDQWMVFFKFRGNAFAAVAARAVDGTEFRVDGDFPEKSAPPGFTASTQVTGTFNTAANEVRIVFPRDLIGHTRAGDKLTDIVIVTYTGAGSLATQQTGAQAGGTVDSTEQPGPSAVIGAPSCVAAS